MMPDFSHILLAIGIVFGLFAGLSLTILLIALGHGWWSFLALPATPIVMGLFAYVWESRT